MGTRRQTQKEATRQRIRTVAGELFIEQGYEATTSRQIAAAADVAVGTLFVHFESKHDILADILFADIEVTVASAFRSLPDDGDTVTKLLHLMAALYGYYAGQMELSRVLLQHSLFAPAGADNFDPQLAAFVAAVSTIIQQGQQEGEVTTRKPPQLLADLYMATYFYGLLAVLRRGSTDIRPVMSAVEQMLNGFLPV